MRKSLGEEVLVAEMLWAYYLHLCMPVVPPKGSSSLVQILYIVSLNHGSTLSDKLETVVKKRRLCDVITR